MINILKIKTVKLQSRSQSWEKRIGKVNSYTCLDSVPSNPTCPLLTHGQWSFSNDWQLKLNNNYSHFYPFNTCWLSSSCDSSMTSFFFPLRDRDLGWIKSSLSWNSSSISAALLVEGWFCSPANQYEIHFNFIPLLLVRQKRQLEHCLVMLIPINFNRG